LGFVGVIYLLFTGIFTVASKKIEKLYQY
ncbi:amino acid ABC transporter permease, partial [Enterococcus faecalis]